MEVEMEMEMEGGEEMVGFNVGFDFDFNVVCVRVCG